MAVRSARAALPSTAPSRGLRSIGLALALAACSSTSPPASNGVAVHVGSVGVDPRSGAPVVVLVEDGGGRALPIWIGFAEASSIAAEIAQQKPPRPNTHDLLKHVIDELDGKVVRAIVTELRDGTYFARLHVLADGRELEIDARPSDAVALALRAGAPLFVREPLFDAARDAPEGGDAPGREAQHEAPTRSDEPDDAAL
jgi:bifunctional DNase/RNase